MLFSEIRSILSRYKVGIAGAGGLGSNCAAALVRSGIGTLVISDFDIVETRNLNRQFYFSDQTGMYKTAALKENLFRITTETNVIAHTEKLDPENIPLIFAGCDIIVEAFDNSEMKEILIETVQLKMPGTILIIGSGMAGWGNSETLKQRKIDDTFYVCGDESTEVSDSLPPLAPRVGIVANMQANIVLEILLSKNHNS
jgi:sulfur carrier protein ThiS adenylyltransferase